MTVEIPPEDGWLPGTPEEMWINGVYSDYMINPNGLLDFAHWRMTQTRNTYLINLIANSDLFLKRGLRSTERMQQDRAFREGVSLAFLYYDFAAEINGQRTPIVDIESQKRADAEFRALDVQLNFAHQHLTRPQAQQFQERRLQRIVEGMPRPLLGCMLGILRDSAIYSGRPESQFTFLSGLWQVHALFKPTES